MEFKINEKKSMNNFLNTQLKIPVTNPKLLNQIIFFFNIPLHKFATVTTYTRIDLALTIVNKTTRFNATLI